MNQVNRAQLMQMMQEVLAKQNSGQPARLVKSFDQIARDSYPRERGGFTGDKAVQSLQSEINALRKSATTGTTEPIRLENLDPTLTEVLFTESWIKLFNAVPRVASKNRLYEYNRKMDYGSIRGTAGFVEGGAPQGSTATYRRDTAEIRYLGERGGVTHQLSAAGAAGGTQLDPTAEENRNTTIRLLSKVERGIVNGDSRIHDTSGQVVNYDGIRRQMESQASTHVIDMRGAPMTFDTLETLAYNLFTEGKLLGFDRLQGFASPFVRKHFASLILHTERSVLSETGKGMLVPGTPFKGYQSQFGFIPIDDSIFLEDVEGSQPLSAPDVGAPDQIAENAVTAVASDASALTKLEAGTYYYWVAAFNMSGENVARVCASAPTAGDGQQVTITVTSQPTGATGYRIYRGISDDLSSARWIATIPKPGAGNPEYIDQGQVIPDTGTAIFFNADPQDIAIAQLAPLTKWPLAVVNTTVEFLLLLYHTLVIKAPERVYVYKNIGRTSSEG
jgi:hypothetical protein